MASNSKNNNKTKKDLTIIFSILGVWLGSWFFITWWAKIGGGEPRYNPVSYLEQFSKMGRANFTIWSLVGAQHPINAFMLIFAIILSMVFLAILIFGIIWLVNGGIPALGFLSNINSKEIHNTTHLAKNRDYKDMIVKKDLGDRIIVGTKQNKTLALDPESSLLIIGATRSGKTRNFIIPNLYEWDGPAIVTSTKAELVRLTAPARQRKGPVYIYDPSGEFGIPGADHNESEFPTTTWSPLSRCLTHDDAMHAAETFVNGSKPKNKGGENNDWEHWATAGTILVTALFYIAANKHFPLRVVGNWIDGQDLDTPLEHLCSIVGEGEFAKFGQKIMEQQGLRKGDAIEIGTKAFIEGRFLELMTHDKNGGDHQGAKVRRLLSNISNRPEKELATVFSTLTKVFKIFHEENIIRSTDSSIFDPETFLRSNGTLYLQTPADNPDRIAGLFATLVKFSVTTAKVIAAKNKNGRLERPLLLALDELANVCPIDDLDTLASEGAGRGILLMSVVQDLSQLRERYGEYKTNTIINNHRGMVLLPGAKDAYTLDLFSKLTGKEEIDNVSHSYGQGKPSRTVSKTQQDLFSSNAFVQLSSIHAVLLYVPRPPFYIQMRPWDSIEKYRKYSELFYHPGLDVIHEDIEDDKLINKILHFIKLR